MIRIIDQLYVLQTQKTTYAFQVTKSGHLEHLYYGRRIRLERGDFLCENRKFLPGNCIAYEQTKQITLEDLCLEMSSYGKGDIREPFVEIEYPDGSSSSDFVFCKSLMEKGKCAFKTLPGSYGMEEEIDHLVIILEDRNQKGLFLELHYYVYEDLDVITRSSRIINCSQSAICVQRLMSCQIDFEPDEFSFTTFTGAWAREMQMHTQDVLCGNYVNSTVCGNTSFRNQSFVILQKKETAQNHGECYGFHLIYSGNHMESVSVNSFGKIRLLTGINPQTFSFTLEETSCEQRECYLSDPLQYLGTEGNILEAPEAVFSYSSEGFNGLSVQLHTFIREHIVRGYWKEKERPILLNSWEAVYFKTEEKKLLALAKEAAKVGIELFVVDDGWFGNRTDDSASLGDWKENDKKLPHGLKGLCDKIHALGMEFGIWVEPEMVNTDSDLYRKHPEWVLQIPGKAHSEGRNQRILDLGQTQVQDYIIGEMTRLFSSCSISYVKWDMNRIMSDRYSQSLSTDKQGETAHRYILGLYRCMKELTLKFPEILFEGCASGGNRFDLGILCYFPQIWASDNTDAWCRAAIQEGYSYGYPQSVFTNHVSGCPNHQTLRVTPLESRFETAAFGILGYECNLCDCSTEEKEKIAEQIWWYKKYRKTLQYGQFYRSEDGYGKDHKKVWTCVNKEKDQAVGYYMQSLMIPNTQNARFKAVGLDPEKLYHVTNRQWQHDIREFGDLINTVSPVHLKKDSFLLDMAAKYVTLEGEKEEYSIYGSALMYAGMRLKAAFCGTGYSDEVRVFSDFASRMYLMEADTGDEN